MTDVQSDSETGRRPDSLTLAVLLEILFRSKWKILLAGFCSLLASTVFAFLLPLQYTAVASFLPPGTNTPSSAAAMMGQLSSMGGLGLLGGHGQGDLYVGILKSRGIASTLVQHFDLMTVYKQKKESAAENLLAKRSSFEVGTKDQIVTVQVTDQSPQRAAAIANGYLQVLQEKTANLAITESSQRRLFYEQRLAKEKSDLASAEVALKQDQEKSGLIAPAGQTAAQIQTLAQMQAQITDRQTRLAAMLHSETEESEDVVRLKKEIGSLQAQIALLENGPNKGAFRGFSASAVPSLELEYIRKAREVKYHEALFDIIAKQYEAARMDEARDAPLQILDPATVPDTKSGPSRSLIMAVGLVMGLLAGAAFVVFQEFSRRRPAP